MTKILAENVENVMEIGEREAITFNKKRDDNNCTNSIDEEDNDKGEDPGQDEKE